MLFSQGTLSNFFSVSFVDREKKTFETWLLSPVILPVPILRRFVFITVLCYDVFITVEEETAMASGHYEQSLYDEFVKVLDRLDTMKKETDQKIAVLNNEISDLKNNSGIFYRTENRPA